MNCIVAIQVYYSETSLLRTILLTASSLLLTVYVFDIEFADIEVT